MTEPGEIVRIAARGDGVARDGRHAAFAAPGDRIADDGTVTPGPRRAVPPCRHFGRCGGCQLQHLSDEDYARFVTDRIAGALAAQGLDAPLRTPYLSPPRSRRRLSLHAERSGNGVVLGLSEAGSNRLVDLAECVIARPEIERLIKSLRSFLRGRIEPRRRAEIHLSRTDQGIDLLCSGIVAEGIDFAAAVVAFAQAHGIARLSVDTGYGAETRWEPAPVTVTMGDVAVPFPPASFLQATADGEAALVAAVREAVGDAATIADLFAGLGTFALQLPGKVYAGEAGRDVLLSLKAAAQQAGRPVFAEHRDLFRRPLAPAELDRFDAVVLDPPRAGAREQVAQLAQSKVRRIAYVSCNPSSFARDAKTLCEAGFGIDWVQPVGQFRWSTHVELAASLSRDHASG